ncbi:MAG: molybdopterin molybdotransferase MoeA [Phycisphaerales bacterium]|nr:molybdopterin molybdotransferase MoeA [Phycisphaerales bacterium]
MTTPHPSGNLPDYTTALSQALQCVAPLDQIEPVPLSEAAGRVLAEGVHADRDYPPFNRATMDGYAVRSSDIGHIEAFRVVGMVAAGSAQQPPIAPGQAARIATGAPLPPDADAVIPHELSDRGDPVRFSISSLELWDNVHRQAADAKAGQEVLKPATLLGAPHLGILATVGCTSVPVRRRPVVALLTSGDEVLSPDAPRVLDHQIRNSGQSMLRALIESMGGQLGSAAHVRDEQNETDRAVAEALVDHDLLVTIGGISAGERDCFHAAFEAAEVKTVIRGAAIQPGKPIFIGCAERGDRRRLVVALPGNPVSVLATAHLFLWPILRVLAGLPPALPWTKVRLRAPVRPNARRQAFRPGAWSRLAGEAEVLDWAGSGDLIHTAATDGLIELPIQADTVESGAALRFLPWCWVA